MANYKSVTAEEVYIRGGSYDGEIGNEKKKCVRYADRTAWCQSHSCAFNKTTSLIYSDNSVLAIDDIQINGQQQQDEPVITNKIYEFDNYQNFNYLYVRATSRSCTNRVSLNPSNCGGGASILNGSGSGLVYHPPINASRYIFSAYEDFRPETKYVNGVVYYIINGVQYEEEEFYIVNAQGTWVYPSSDNILHIGDSLYKLNNYITLDFGGENCRGKYFSFFVGLDEEATMLLANNQTPTGEYQVGWNTPTMVGYGNKTYLNNGNANAVKTYISGSEALPEYKSVDSIYVSSYGFTVLFKDTNQVNNDGYEIIVVGMDLDNNVWNTTNKGFVFKCQNYRMS